MSGQYKKTEFVVGNRTIYIVKVSATNGSYKESIEVLEYMAEKEKSFVGSSRRIQKKQIGIIEEDIVYGMFKMAVLEKESIQEAREQLNRAVYEYNKEKMEQYQKSVEAAMSHDLSKEIKL